MQVLLQANFLSKAWALVTKEPVLAILVAALIALQVLYPKPWASLPALIDWQTVLTLAGLLMLTKAVELSGFLMWMAHRVVHRIHGERGLAFLLIGLAAVLSTLLTNDVALFAVVPLTLSLHKLAPLPIKRLVIFIAIAVNAGSILTPLGNPQNLFLLADKRRVIRRVRVGVAAVMCSAHGDALRTGRRDVSQPAARSFSGDTEAHSVDIPLCTVAGIAFIAFVVLADAHRAAIGLAAVALGFLLWRRQVVLKIDWLLLLIFVLMFIVLRGVAALPWVHHAIASLGLDSPLKAYAAGAVLSQGISNVPAAIMLAEFSKDWRALAFGVSVGGFGIAIGSLANLIAVRLSGERGMWGPFHLISIPFWIVAAAAGAWLV